MNFYPYTSPFILDDTVFEKYGGDVTLGTSDQRDAAYLIAEMEVSENLDTFLTPTIITGTYQPAWTILLDHAYINYISTVRLIDEYDRVFFTVSGTGTGYFTLRDDTYGVIDLYYLKGLCCPNAFISKIQVVYNAGLPSGTVLQSNMLLALSSYAKIIINEIIGFGNEGPGDVGIESFNAQQYAERRRIQNTDFGSSPQAMFVNRLLKPLRRHRYVGL